MLGLLKLKPIPEDGQMELMEHLAELRTRIFRSVLYLIFGMILTYNLYPWIMKALTHPLAPVLDKFGKLMFGGISEGFFLRMQICVISGLIVTLPLLVLEIWGFIAPALTDNERKPVSFLAPFSVLLFLAGVGTGYICLPITYQWMGSFIADVPGAELMQNTQQYILLTLKILLGFGVSFQLPLILLFFARVGLITDKMMVQYWRHAVVGISIFAAILTPTPDPLSMMILATPMTLLYALSILLVKAFQPREDGTRTLSFATMFISAMAPVIILGAVGYWIWRTNGPAVAQPNTEPTPAVTATATPPGATPTPAPTATPPAVDLQGLMNRLDELQRQNAELQRQNAEVLRRVQALEEKAAPKP